MTGFDIFETAITRLGLVDSKGSIEQQVPFRKTALSVINELSEEFCNLPPIKNLSDEIVLDKKAFSLITYGTAYALSVIMGDAEKQTTMLAIFNAKRTLFLSEVKKIKDVFPTAKKV